MSRLAIWGAGGHGKVIADAALLSGWSDIDFFDDAWPLLNSNSHWPVVGDTSYLLSTLSEYDGYIIAIGDNLTRQAQSLVLKGRSEKLVSVVHPSSVVSSFSKIGLGSFIAAGAVVNADVVLGSNCIVNTNAVVEHDCWIGDAVHISPSASLAGGVCVNDRSWVGIGACVRQNITIGNDVVVGAGGVVINDVADGQCVVGIPAKVISC